MFSVSVERFGSRLWDISVPSVGGSAIIQFGVMNVSGFDKLKNPNRVSIVVDSPGLVRLRIQVEEFLADRALLKRIGCGGLRIVAGKPYPTMLQFAGPINIHFPLKFILNATGFRCEIGKGQGSDLLSYMAEMDGMSRQERRNLVQLAVNLLQNGEKGRELLRLLKEEVPASQWHKVFEDDSTIQYPNGKLRLPINTILGELVLEFDWNDRNIVVMDRDIVIPSVKSIDDLRSLVVSRDFSPLSMDGLMG
jgi:hypothetical protein